MNDTNPQELQEALEIYKERYGSTKQVDMFKLDDIIREMRGEKNGK